MTYFFKNKIAQMSYRNKITFCYFLIVILPYISGVCYLYSYIVKSERTNIIATIDQKLLQDKVDIDNRMKSIHETTYYIANNNTLAKFFIPNYYQDAELITTLNETINPIISWMQISTDQFGSFRFLTTNSAIPENDVFINSNPYQSLFWAKTMKKKVSLDGYYLSDIHESEHFPFSPDRTDKIFSLYYPMPLSSNTYLEMIINPSYLLNNISELPMVQAGQVIFLSNNDQILSSQSSEDSKSLQLNQKLVKKYKNKIIQLNDKDYFLTSREIPSLQGNLVALIPQLEIIRLTRNSIILFSIVTLCITLVVLLLAFVSSTLLVNRINKMHAAVQVMQSGDFDIHIPVKGNDEIDQLAVGINIMSTKIDELINNVYEAEMNQKDAELAALQSQINPHFLFNILETFRMLAEMGRTEQLAQGIEALGNLMRHNLANSKDLVPIQDEISIIKDFVHIHNLLNNQRITLDIYIQGEYQDILIPTFILQPIVENCINYGLKNETDKLQISIRIIQMSRESFISISDDGRGLKQEKLITLKETVGSKKRNSKEKSIGLWNVNQRLILQFGQRAAIKLESKQYNGFSVSFLLPTTRTLEETHV